jgi:dimethylargininase
MERAQDEHVGYERVLERLGCEVRRLPAAPGCPDSVFIEDTAVVLPEIAVVCRPGAPSRLGEVDGVARALAEYRRLAHIVSPGTLDGGDVLRIDNHLYVGLSRRTNVEGIRQLTRIVTPHGYRVVRMPVSACLHLKSAVSTIPGAVLVNPDWVEPSFFGTVKTICVDSAEPFAANVLSIGDTVILARHHPRTRRRLKSLGLCTVSVSLRELAKAEGGVTCCSLILENGG